MLILITALKFHKLSLNQDNIIIWTRYSAYNINEITNFAIQSLFA